MTPEQVKSLLLTNDRAVERAILALHARQTESERAAGRTVESNGEGFNAFDAESGKYFADWLNKRQGNQLTGNFLVRARKMVLKYTKQLSAIAVSNRANKAA